MPTQAEITASVNNSPQHLLERMMANPDQTVTTPPIVIAAVTLPNLVLALATTGIIEIQG
jgi:hypothetical protein